MRNFKIAQWLRKLSIRQKLVYTFLIITLIPLALLAYLINRSSQNVLTQAANSALFSTASQIASSIDTFISNEIEFIEIEAQLPIFQDYLNLPVEGRENSELEKQAQSYLTNLYELRKSQGGVDGRYLLGFSLLDRSGTVLIDTHPFSGEKNPYVGVDWSERNYFAQPFLLGFPYSSPVEIPQEGGVSSTNFSARLTNELNQPIGVLIAHYDGRIIQEMVKEMNNVAGPGSFGAVFDENSIYLAHGTNPDILFTTVANLDETLLEDLRRIKRLPDLPSSEIIYTFPELQAGLENDLPFFAAKDPSAGEQVNQVAVVQLKNHPWRVAFFQPENIFLETARQQTENVLLFSILIAFLTLGAALLAAQGLGTPITNLTAIAEQVTAGNLNLQALVTSQDEIGALAQAFNNMTDQLRQTLEGLEQRITERTLLLQTSIEVGQAATSILNPEQLINKVVNLITNRFGYYYAAVFLNDEFNEWAELKDATGDAGKALLARQHRLRIGENSMVGTAIATKQARIALDVGAEAIRFNNPLLSGTRSEIAVPLLAGGEVIGALDVQSTNEAAFSDQDIETMQNMANQIAIAIQNARLYQKTQYQLEEINNLNQIFMRENWEHIRKNRPSAYHVRQNQLAAIDSPQIPHIENAIRENIPVLTTENDSACITLPLVLRGYVLGAIHLKSNNSDWSSDDLTLIESVTRQATLALENARLVETSQQLAQREQQINQISSKIRGSTNIETILKTTLSQIATVLNIQEASIQLNPTKTEDNGMHNPNLSS
jgi:GAF domain-containing protein